jgi:hypothetical protein
MDKKLNTNQKVEKVIEESNPDLMSKSDARMEARKALKWIVRSGTAQVIIGTLTASSISYINREIALTIFITNILSVLGQGLINYLDYLKNEMN